MKFTLLIPTMDEIEGMRQVMPRINKDWVDEIIVVDGGSDGTYEYGMELGYTVIKQKTKGLLEAYREGVAAAKGDVIITFSPDGNSVPELIPELVSKMREGYDMVIVSRYRDGAKSEDDDTVTAFGNWLFTATINLLFGGTYTDSLVMFRAWRKELFQYVQDDWVGRCAGTEPMLAIMCARHKHAVGEIPGDEPARIGGVRKMNILVGGTGISLLLLKEFLVRRPKIGAAAPEARDRFDTKLSDP